MQDAFEHEQLLKVTGGGLQPGQLHFTGSHLIQSENVLNNRITNVKFGVPSLIRVQVTLTKEVRDKKVNSKYLIMCHVTFCYYYDY